MTYRVGCMRWLIRRWNGVSRGAVQWCYRVHVCRVWNGRRVIVSVRLRRARADAGIIQCAGGNCRETHEVSGYGYVSMRLRQQDLSGKS